MGRVGVLLELKRQKQDWGSLPKPKNTKVQGKEWGLMVLGDVKAAIDEVRTNRMAVIMQQGAGCDATKAHLG